MDQDVCVDEHEHVAGRTLRSGIARLRRPRVMRAVNDEDLLWRSRRLLDSRPDAFEGLRSLRCRDDCCQTGCRESTGDGFGDDRQVETATSLPTRLEVHGLRVAVKGDWPDVVDQVRRDFAWFERPAAGELSADVTVTVERRPPDFDALGEGLASFVTPRNVVYQDGRRTIVDYFGRAVSILDRSTGGLVIQGEDDHLVHEAAYHFLLSRIGEHLEARGLTRLHALGVSGAQGAVAVTLPSGGGKSTLALRALREEGVRLLSEDSPLIDRHGMAHAFPLRIAVNPTDAATLPEGSVRRMDRMEFHPKLVLDVEAFADRVESRPQPLRHLVIGRRSLGRQAALEPLPRRSAVSALFREAIVGVGIYQGMEFVLQHGMGDVVGKVGVAATRTSCCAGVLARAKVWQLTVGRDHRRNWDVLAPLLG